MQEDTEQYDRLKPLALRFGLVGKGWSEGSVELSDCSEPALVRRRYWDSQLFPL